MNTVSSEQVIGIDVSRAWLDIYCRPHGKRLRLPNTSESHAHVASLTRRRGALVCFEGCEDEKTVRGTVFPSGGGQEWR